ncbi:MAG: bifunctional metallophosphatase/5'-nucleotidase [Saprospiraceae bacterium]
MKSKLLFLTTLFILCSCHTSTRVARVESDHVKFTILQFNDFYEIAPLEGGKIGGAARMATLRKKLILENPNVLTVLAGDFISPSLLGTLKADGEGIKGKHIIEVMNAIGIDLVTFGNHEFDYDQKTLQKRINESSFDWVSTNVNEIKDGKIGPFNKMQNGITLPIPKSKVITFTNANGQKARLGFVAPCVDANRVKYVEYENINTSLKRELTELADKADIFISLSHLNKEQDLQTATDFPVLDFIFGGHEHDNMIYTRGKTTLTKADANAKSAYIHRIDYNVKTKKYSANSELVKLNSTIPLDDNLSLIVKKWKDLEYQIIRNMGFDPDQRIPGAKVNYDARETILRNKPAEFTEMICKSMQKTCPGSEAAILNSGCVRLDDILTGYISQYDILRALPYAGAIVQFNIKGSLLLEVLDAGWNNKGKGGFLQWSQIERTSDSKWLINKKMIEPSKTYPICMNEFLLTGLEKGLEFLTKENPNISNIKVANPEDKSDLNNDIRLVIIDYLKKGGR